MDRDGFRQLLRDRQVPEDQIEGQIALAERFEGFADETPVAEDVRAFSALLVEEELNTWDNLAAVARYGRFTNNDPAYVAALDWEVIFDQPLRAEIVETVLRGDPWCKIAIHLPRKALAGANP